MTIISVFTLFGLIANVIIIIVLLLKGFSDSFEKKIIIFNLALLFWQVEDFLLRITAPLEIIYTLDQFFSFFWIFIGFFLMETIYAAKFTVIKHYFWLRSIFFLISLFFFASYISFPTPRLFLQSDLFGLVLGFRDGSMDLLLRFWIGFSVVVSLIIVLYALFKNTKFRKLKIIFLGLLIPTVYGLVFQVYFPSVYGYEIPGTTILFSIFSILHLLISKDNIMFMNFGNESFNSVFDQINSIVFGFDEHGTIYYGNSLYRSYYGDIDSIYDFAQGNKFLSSIDKFIKDENNGDATGKNSNILISEERIRNEYFQYIFYPIQVNKIIRGAFVFGLNVTKVFQMKTALMNSFNNFKRLSEIPNSYFLEIDLGNNQVIFNDKFRERFNLFDRKKYSYIELVHYLKKLISHEDIKFIFSILRSDRDSVFKRSSSHQILRVQNQSVFFAFEVSFKKFDQHVITNNHLIYLSDITSNYIDSLKDNWIDKSTPWIVSHVFRKPVANILGLMNLVINEKGIFESRLSTFEIFSLINSEIKELDSKIEVFSENNSDKSISSS